MSNASKKTSTVGEIVNLMSVDAQRFMDLMTYFHTIWSGPFQICVSLYFLWQTLGPSVLAGVGVMVLLIPINALIAHKTRQLQVKQMTLKDSRIKLMNEVLNGIKVLKLYAWELSFQDKILHIRRQELEVLKKAAYLNACSSFAWTCAPFMVSLTTFAVYTLSDSNNILDAEKAFVSLSLFNIMRFPLSMLPNVITNIVQASVSLKRLQKFLDNEELDSDAVQRDPQSKAAVKIENGTFSWDRVDKIVVLKDGQVSEVGTFTQLMDHNGAFAEFLKNYLTQEMDDGESPVDPSDLEALSMRDDIISHLGSIIDPSESAKLQRQITLLSERVRTESEMTGSTASIASSGKGGAKKLDRQVTVIEEGKNIEKQAKEDKLIQAESVETGRVKFSVFLAYLKAVGALLSLIIVAFYVLYNAASIYSNIWLSDWSNDARRFNGTADDDQRNMRLGVYGALGALQGVFIFAGTLIRTLGARNASRHLHTEFLANILRCPMHFFDVTPLGRIVNRFSKDIDAIDVTVPMNAHMFLMCFLHVLGTIVVISMGTPLFLSIILPLMILYYLVQLKNCLACLLAATSTIMVISMSTPIFLSVIVPLGILYFLVQRFYVATSRQLKRLESTSRSPIYSHFGETITGAITIRAFQQEQRFIEQSENKVDENQVCYYPSIVSNRWLAIRLEFVGNCIIFFASLFAVLGREHLSPGIVGLSVSYAMNTLNWMVRMTCELETNIVAVERVKEYTEAPTEVGIVGRTGAGKSSLTLALFRIIEAAGGNITVDDINIGEIGLHDLRSKLTIIPQDPVVFSGSLRMNLDPFEKHSDEELWQALEHAHLKNFVQGLSQGLQYECTEGGENLSVGQRQLLCLARALLRKTKILILDEATAAVDLETDDLIQGTIRTEFKDCTVLTIAHRLNTILDYTRILVLDAGKIAEFDDPQALLQNPESIFHGMAKDAGLV
nr:hypothetical protein BaRGS_025036 [Batillaria attramentaria]